MNDRSETVGQLNAHDAMLVPLKVAASKDGRASDNHVGGRVELVDLARQFGDFHAVKPTSLTIEPGEFLTLLGSSGSGKTTTLMMVAGFVTPSAGDILINGKSMARLAPEKRNLGVVFQNYALFPHMTVAENVRYPLRMRGWSKSDMDKAVAEALAMVQLVTFGDRRISQLSGGQQQRVALARALVFRPPVLLMDEPLGALDRRLREHMQSEIKRIQKSLRITVIYVTHDQEEAMSMSDRIAVMHNGAVAQIGTPSEIYETPSTEYVASFVGESNIVNGTFVRFGGGFADIALASGEHIRAPSTGGIVGGPVRVMMRPEAFHVIGVQQDEKTTTDLSSRSADIPNSVEAVVVSVEYLGQAIRYVGRTKSDEFILRLSRRDDLSRYEPGERVVLTWSPKATVILDNAAGATRTASAS